MFESIPQIPINVKEIKKIILKDQFISSDQSIDENELLNVLTANCKGRNALFFKAYGHAKVFGLRSSIPDGSTQILDAGTFKSLVRFYIHKCFWLEQLCRIFIKYNVGGMDGFFSFGGDGEGCDKHK